MPPVKLTDPRVASLKCKADQQLDTYDSLVRGLGVRSSPGGTKTFFVMYRYQGRARRLTLGRYGILTLSAAREMARQALGDLADGIDPSVRRMRARLKPACDRDTFVGLVDEYFVKYAKHNNRSWHETRRLLTREFVSKWSARDIRQIDKSDVNSVLDQIVARGSSHTANHAFACLRRLFNWAVERGYLEHSPCAGSKPPTPIVSRERVLSDQELANVWRAATDISYPYGRIVQLLILTAQRRDEVAQMRWEDLDLNNGIWTIPAALNKSNREHTVPLPDICLQIINACPRDHSQLVFPARGKDVAVSGFSKWKRQLDERCGVKNWRIHDLRRTAATGMAALDVEPHVIDRVLNHAQHGIAGVYNRYKYRDQISNALAVWSNHVATLIK